MEDKDRVRAYVDLYRQQMEHYHKTQAIEWKGSFGVWTLLAGAIYLTAKEKITVPMFVAFAGPVVVSLVHWFWLWQIHKSEAFDRKLWIRYRKEARLILLGSANLPPDEEFKERADVERMIWLLLEVGITVILSGILTTLLICRLHA